MSDLEKINIYVTENIRKRLHEDARMFEIFRKDNITINLNGFLSRVILGYYHTYVSECNEIYAAIRQELALAGLQKMQQDLLAADIMNHVVFPSVTEEEQRKTCRLSLKPTNDTEGILVAIKDGLSINDSVSNYLFRMFESYCRKPMYEREQLVFDSCYEFLIGACASQRPIAFTTIWNKQVIHEVTPYQVVTGTEEMYNYLLCQEIDEKTGQLEARSYRLNRICRPTFSRKPMPLSEQVQLDLDRMKHYGPQYAINDDEETLVKLSDKGVLDFRRIYYGRPMYETLEEKPDGAIYHFRCSKDQLYFYFRRFNAGSAEVLSPQSLRSRIQQFHATSLLQYDASDDQD